MKAKSDPFNFDPLAAELPSVGSIKLDVGSGDEYQRRDSSWMTVDRFCKCSVRADMWSLPFADGTVDAIWSSHALEHVPRERVIPTLTEWHRVLKPDAPCTIQTPDMDYLARLWLEHGDAALTGIFGSQAHEGEFHKTGWTLAGLCRDVVSVGFTVRNARSLFTPDYTQNSLRVEAVK